MWRNAASGPESRCSVTTRLVGSLKNSMALSEFFIIQANNRSRHSAMPGRSFEAISF
ncbi:MAG: hypothetical protein ABIN41_02465 [Devosia sp.]